MAVPPSGRSIDYAHTAFTTAILQEAERVAPPREEEADINMALTAR